MLHLPQFTCQPYLNKIMKMNPLSCSLPVLLLAYHAYAQGSFVYDQQSSTDESALSYGSGSVIQQMTPPWGQSFTPTLTSIGFIRLKLDDGIPHTPGATMIINLRAGSIGGLILGSTEPISMPSGFTGVESFFFSTPISLTPGTVYYFEPVVVSGGLWNISISEYNYPGGSAWSEGQPGSGADLWFREGIIVPEPSCAALALLGALALRLACRRRTA